MARTLSNPLQLARRLLESERAIVLLVRVPIPGGGEWRLARCGRNVTAGGQVWQRCDMAVRLPDEDGTISGIGSVTVSNVSRLPGAWMESDLAPLAQMATFYVTRQTAADADSVELDDQASFSLWMLRATISSRRVSIECGSPPDLIEVPQQVYDRKRFKQLLPGGGVRVGNE